MRSERMGTSRKAPAITEAGALLRQSIANAMQEHPKQFATLLSSARPLQKVGSDEVDETMTPAVFESAYGAMHADEKASASFNAISKMNPWLLKEVVVKTTAQMITAGFSIEQLSETIYTNLILLGMYVQRELARQN